MNSKQAMTELKRRGLRAARLAACPQIKGWSAAYGVVRLARGLKNESLTEGELVAHPTKAKPILANSIEELLKLCNELDVDGKAQTLNGNYPKDGKGKAKNGEMPDYSDASDEAKEADADADAEGKTEGEGKSEEEAKAEADAKAKAKAEMEQSRKDRDTSKDGPLDQRVRDICLEEISEREKLYDRIGVFDPKTGEVTEEALKGLTDKVVAEVKGKIPPMRVEVPSLDLDLKTDGEHEKFALLVRYMALGFSTMLVGPAGSGKTTCAEKAMEAIGLKPHRLEPATDRHEVLGFRDAAGNYQDTAVYRWATTEGAGLLVDEGDRFLPRALTALHGAMANKVIEFPHERVEIPAGNVIVMTANTWGTGPDAEYVAAGRLDAATLDRFCKRIVWDYDERIERIMVAESGLKDEKADRIYTISRGIRDSLNRRKVKIIWSPRSTAAFALDVAAGAGMKEALETSVLCTLERSLYDGVVADAFKFKL